MDKKTIYELELHECLLLEDTQITRVAGGWIYRYWDYENKDYYTDSTFVPYNNEFYQIKNPKPGIWD